MSRNCIYKVIAALCCISFLMLTGFSAGAQTPPYYDMNTGSGNNWPLSASTNKVQWIYGPNFFKSNGTIGTPAPSGLITTVYIRPTALNSVSFSDFTVSLGQTMGTDTTFSSTAFLTNLSTVYTQNGFVFTGAVVNNWYAITLQTPFQYDPTMSLVVEIKTSSSYGLGAGVALGSINGNGNRRNAGSYAATSGSLANIGIVNFGVGISSGPLTPVTSVAVSTQGSVPATITTNAGTLQMVATVLPATANQNVTWSIVPGTGTATISTAGLVTAQTNGTVWAKAVSVADATKLDSMQITLSNQAIAVTSVAVSTLGSVPATITTNAGTLQMVATVLPAAANQNVTWSIVPGTGTATISTAGLVTAQTNGTVWAKAVSVADATKRDSMLVTLSNQVVPVTSVTVSTQGSVPATITTNAGTLQMVATVLPAAANQNVTWSIVPGTGTATISTAGLVTAQTNGTVWAKAVSVADATKRDSMLITISNQVVAVISVTVHTQGSVPATITTNAGILQMEATVLPAAANQNVSWSIVPGTGTATISTTGLVTAQTNGTVWAKAVSVTDATKLDSLQITISNQSTTVTSVIVNTQNNVPASISVNGGNLQMEATVLPAGANQNVSWSIVPGTGTATISASGWVTAQTNGTVWAKAVSIADATKLDSMQINISNQTTSINNLAITLDELKLYPNPTNGLLNIENSSRYQLKQVIVVNVLGQQVYLQKVNNNHISINLAALSAGVYQVRILFEEGEVNRKLSIKH